MNYITLFFTEFSEVLDFITENNSNIKDYAFKSDNITYITTYDNKRIECII